MIKIGILGGTFNPIHNGHILLAKYCKSELGLDKIIFIPTYTPPHKISKNLASETHRLKMCEIACKNFACFEVSDIEILRKGKSYTYQTLNSLKEKYSDDELYLIMGADMFLSLDKWKNPNLIFDCATMVTIPRDTSNYKDLCSYYDDFLNDMGAKAVILPNPVMMVSSTFIRDNINNFDIIKDFVDKNVYEYIINNNLYRM